jgi:protein arginine kinase activator
MICQVCKDKVATIRLKEIINDEVTELHLCKECFEARERQGGSAHAGSPEGKGKKKLSLESKPIQCPTCGTTSDELRANGRLGCGDCYKTFAVSLEPIISRVHGFTEHRGKSPAYIARNLDLKTELRRLQTELQDAILTENYERAARLRDKIKQFEDMNARKGAIEEPYRNV